MNVHSLKSALGYHFSARRGVYSPLLGSTSRSVSRNGSYWRWSGRETTQKRLLSSNPAEAKTSRCVFASWAEPEMGSVATAIARGTATASARKPSVRLIGLLLSDMPELGVEVVAQPVAQKIQREHGQHDGQPGEHRHPPRGHDQLPAVGDHEPPGGSGAREPRAQEAQRRLEEDHVANLERGEDDQRVDDIGEDVARHDAGVGGARQ